MKKIKVIELKLEEELGNGVQCTPTLFNDSVRRGRIFAAPDRKAVEHTPGISSGGKAHQGEGDEIAASAYGLVAMTIG